MKILVACEFSGVVRNAFRQRGHDAWSCDLLPAADNSEYHLQTDALEVIYSDFWDLLIAHPPCTYLANSGVHLLHKDETRWAKMIKAAEFFRAFLHAPIEHICVENPIPHKYAMEHIGQKYTQTIQPYEFGHNASKRTCLWLKNLPPLKSTKLLKKPPNGHWSNQTPSGQNKLGPSSNRSLLRSVTYQGVAEAMEEQWKIPNTFSEMAMMKG